MKVRGERECQSCGARWSYYDIGEVSCPECGSLRSVGVGSRRTHTDAPATLDLTPHRSQFGEAQGILPSAGVRDLKADLRAYLRRRGFINDGTLQPLDTTYLAARELLEAADAYDRLVDPTDEDRAYLLALLAGADDGDRPETAAVPRTLREARGMATVHACSAYRDDLSTFLDELSNTDGGAGDETGGAGGGGSTDADDDSRHIVADDDPGPAVTVEGTDPTARIRPARDRAETLHDRIKRVDALGGDVDPAVADALVDAANALGEFVRTGDQRSLDRVDDLFADAATGGSERTQD
ncbi:DUF7117 family protein [Halorubrum vacuolatum]|uniref:TFIIB-type zinc ribbon-containing protein n=1 Tax=Halorubrum vacuolatum TaxID=63740 RepID=A0A238V9A1_HALVU|nr:hypothetical protein [Halorubrum vacuolatum]SNR31012.1 hypothetical protein SAMN06264855_102131 [Halorubrum vacuolatum]